MASRAPGWIHVKFNHFSIENPFKNGLKSPRLDSYEIWLLFKSESIKEWPQELQTGFLWNLTMFQLRINDRIASRAPDCIHMKFDHFSIKNQLKNGLNSSRLDPYEIWSFLIKNQLNNGIVSSRLDSYEIYSLSIKNQLKNGLKSSRLDSCEI